MKTIPALAAGLGAVCAVGSSIAVSGNLAHAPIASTQLVRYATAAALLWAGLRLAGNRLPRLDLRDTARIALLAATGLVGFNLALLGALRHAEPALVGVIVGAAPLVLAIVVPLMSGRRPGRRAIVAAAIVVAGVVIVEGAGTGTRLGILLSVATLGGEVAFTVVAEPVVRRIGAVAVSAWACVAAVVELAVLLPVTDGEAAFSGLTGARIASIAWLGCAATAGGFACWYTALRALGADRAGLLLGLIPVVTTLTAVLVGTGTFGIQPLVGAFVVAAGVTAGLVTRRPVGRASVDYVDAPLGRGGSEAPGMPGDGQTATGCGTGSGCAALPR